MKNSKTKKILSILLAVIMVVGMIPASVISAGATGTEPCESTTDCTGYYENGFCNVCDGYQKPEYIEIGYYEIANAGQLYWFASRVDSGSVDINAKLVADITVNTTIFNEDGTVIESADDTLIQWTPIGDTINDYSGEFDGNGKTISGLYFNQATNYIGLFSDTENAEIHGVTIDNSYFSGSYNVAGIAGAADSTQIYDCINNARIQGGSGVSLAAGIVASASFDTTITNCKNTGTIAGSKQVGGIAGEARFGGVKIEKCRNEGVIRSGYSFIGGIVGSINGKETVIDCTNTGKVGSGGTVGGIVGYIQSSDTKIERCSNFGDVNGGDAGGIVGLSNSPVINCVSQAKITGAGSIGGICGAIYNSITNCYNNGSVSSSDLCGAIAGKIGSTYPENCFYIAYENTNYTGIGNNTDIPGGVDGRPIEDAYSGEITYFLQKNNTEQVWGQTLESPDNDPLALSYGPVLGGEKVYAIEPCLSEFSNTPFDTGKGHVFVNGFCTGCGAVTMPSSDDDGVFEISNAGQLYWFVRRVNGFDSSVKGRLINDIVVNEDVLDENGELSENADNFRTWIPIGNPYMIFTGTFDGNNKTISGLYCVDSRHNAYAGLFGESEGAVYNLGIEDSYFASQYNAGSVAAHNNGTVSNCYSNSFVKGSNGVGGIAGINDGTIENSYNVGKVRGNDVNSAYIGAVAGQNSGALTNNYYLSGSAVDGLKAIQYGVGNANPGIATFDADSKTISASYDNFASGQICCSLQEPNENDVWGQDLKTDDSDTEYDAYPVLGGPKVYASSPCKGQCSNEPIEGNVAHSFNDGICSFCGAYASVQANENGIYEIHNAGELYSFAELVNSGNSDVNGKLLSDITVNDEVLNWSGNFVPSETIFTVWTPIGNEAVKYTGEFDGNGKAISGLYFNSSDEQSKNTHNIGLFGCVDNAKIYGITIKDSYFMGYENIGGIVGQATNSEIADCVNQSAIRCGNQNAGGIAGNTSLTTVSDCRNNGIITGKSTVGGIVGKIIGESENVTAIENCSNSRAIGDGEITSYAGGIVGSNECATTFISYCNNTASVYGSDHIGGIAGLTKYTILKSYNTALIRGTGYVGGIAGESSAPIYYCYSTGDLYSTGAYNGGIVGLGSRRISECFNTGIVKGTGTYNGGILGMSSGADVEDCFYLKDGVSYIGIGSSRNDLSYMTAPATAEEFASGKIAYQLQSLNTEPVWGQSCNQTGGHPIFDSTGFYSVSKIGNTDTYMISGIGDTNSDGVVNVQDYQSLINKILADDHEQIETAEYGDLKKYDFVGDGYLDVLDAHAMHLVINGFTNVDVYAVGDYNCNGMAFEIPDLIAIKHATENPEKLSTEQKHASDINGDGKIDNKDLIKLEQSYSGIDATACEDNIKVYYRWGNNYTTCTATAMCTLCNKKVAVETVDSVLNADGSYTATFTNSLLGTKTYKKQ